MIALPWVKLRSNRKAYRVVHEARGSQIVWIVQSRRWFAVGWTDVGSPSVTQGNAVNRLLALKNAEGSK